MSSGVMVILSNEQESGPAQKPSVKVLALHMTGCHMGTISNSSTRASHPVPSLPGKALKDVPRHWDPTLMWETQKRLLAPGFGLP